MKLIATLALLFTLSACTVAPPKPVNANGTVSPSAVVADADLSYQDAATNATAYVTACHTAPTTPGCNEKLIAQIKLASTQANKALHAAHAAVKNFPQGGSGLDQAIADLQAALVFMTSYTTQIPQNLRAKP